MEVVGASTPYVVPYCQIRIVPIIAINQSGEARHRRTGEGHRTWYRKTIGLDNGASTQEPKREKKSIPAVRF